MLTLQIENQQFENIFKDVFDEQKDKLIEFILEKISESGYSEWSETELKSVGKVGFHSSSFEDDDEDYSKW